MAHGAPRDLDSVEEYVLHIRHGRPLAPVLMADIVSRYRQVGGSPLLKWTSRQTELLQTRLDQNPNTATKVYIGMRHSNPFIKEAVQQMASDGIESVVAVCLAPQFSRLTIGAYQKTLDEAIAEVGARHAMPLQYQLVGSILCGAPDTGFPKWWNWPAEGKCLPYRANHPDRSGGRSWKN